MPYLGRPVTNAGQFEIIDDISSDFDGSETSFSLKVGGTDIQPDVANVTITLGGVYQVPASAYSITGSTINFSEAPESSTAFHGVLAGQSQFIESDFITNTMIKSTANISGSKINTDFSGKTVKAAIFDGMVSSSAQIADNISGSLSQVHLSSKISGIVSASSIASSAQGQVALTTNGVAATAVDLGLQTGDSPTFAGGTITGDFSVGGTITAQEVHTEFESASILFTSGSTQFGNSLDDNHVFSGSLLVTGSLVQLRGDSTKLRFSNDAGAERAFLQLNSTGLNIDTDSFIDFKPNNTFAARFDSNGRLGIGTNNPGNVLHLEFNDDSDVFTAARITDNSVSGILINNLDTGNGHGGMLKFANKNGDNHTAIAHSQDGNTDASLLFYSMDGGTLAEVMRVDHTHAVGIGNSAPAASLHIGSSDGTQYSGTAEPRESMIIQNPSGSDNTAVGLHSTLGFQVADGATSQGFINYVRTGNNTGEFTFSQRTASSTYAEHMRIDSSGNVGIGTNNPGAILDVDSGATGESDSEACGIRVTLQRNGSAQGLTLRHEDASGGSTDASEGTSIQFQGYDGSNSYHNLAAIFGRADGESVSDSDSPGFLTFHTTPDGSDSFSERMRIASDGNVGIGTDSLGDAKLTIDGVQSNDVALKIIQGIAKDALFVDMNANDNAISVASDATTARGLSVSMDSITTGQVANFQSNSSDNSSRFIVRILNDNPSATGAIGLYLQNDAASGAELISGYSDANHFLERHRAGHASYESTIIMSEANRTASPNFGFYRGQSDADGTPDVEFLARGDGVVAGDNAYSVGADYAEYFESKDGSSIPVGTTVKLDGEKIVSCSVGDTPIGVIRPSGASTAVGNTNWNRWGGKYLKDDYGAYVYEEYSATTWGEGEDKKYYHTDRIPSSVTVPSDAIVTTTETNGSKLMRKRLNPNFSESLNYVSREDRDEWNIVGLMGQIEMTKGQPTGSQWIKMKDISDTVELWFVK